MKKQINCEHYDRIMKKMQDAFSYSLIGAELNLCKKCESKLIKQMLEKEMNGWLKK